MARSHSCFWSPWACAPSWGGRGLPPPEHQATSWFNCCHAVIDRGALCVPWKPGEHDLATRAAKRAVKRGFVTKASFHVAPWRDRPSAKGKRVQTPPHSWGLLRVTKGRLLMTLCYADALLMFPQTTGRERLPATAAEAATKIRDKYLNHVSPPRRSLGTARKYPPSNTEKVLTEQVFHNSHVSAAGFGEHLADVNQNWQAKLGQIRSNVARLGQMGPDSVKSGKFGRFDQHWPNVGQFWRATRQNFSNSCEAFVAYLEGMCGMSVQRPGVAESICLTMFCVLLRRLCRPPPE